MALTLPEVPAKEQPKNALVHCAHPKPLGKCPLVVTACSWSLIYSIAAMYSLFIRYPFLLLFVLGEIRILH